MTFAQFKMIELGRVKIIIRKIVTTAKTTVCNYSRLPEQTCPENNLHAFSQICRNVTNDK